MKKPHKESTLAVQNALIENGRFSTEVYTTLVDAFEYAKEKVANFKPELLEEILTIDRKKIIKYNGIEIKSE